MRVGDVSTTNYVDTFIAVAPDSRALAATEPPLGKAPSIARRTFERIRHAPYRFTSDDVIFGVWADRNDVPETEREAARAQFFSKGQPCLRCSDLPKKYGWGVHCDALGRVALVAVESEAYASFARGEGVAKVVPAMRTTR